MPFLRKYGVLTVTGTTAIRVPMVKRAVVDFAVGADWTPAAGDVKILIDGTAAANVTNLPTAIAAGNTAMWEFVLTAAELTGKQIVVTVADSATKAVEDQSFIVETYGNASAMYQPDYSAANLPANVQQLLGTAWLTPGTAGTPDVNTKLLGGTSQTGRDVGASVLLAAGQKVDVDTIKTNPVVNGGTVTFPTGATLASTTNLTAGTVTTATNLTNAPTAGDFTATMKTSIGTAVAASAVASVTAGVTVTTNNDKTGYAIGAGGLAAAGFATDAIDANALAASAATEIVTAMFARAFSAAYSSLTFDQMIKAMSSALISKCSGMATTTAVFRNPGDTADVITATVDSNGNRTAVTVVP